MDLVVRGEHSQHLAALAARVFLRLHKVQDLEAAGQAPLWELAVRAAQGWPLSVVVVDQEARGLEGLGGWRHRQTEFLGRLRFRRRQRVFRRALQA